MPGSCARRPAWPRPATRSRSWPGRPIRSPPTATARSVTASRSSGCRFPSAGASTGRWLRYPLADAALVGRAPGRARRPPTAGRPRRGRRPARVAALVTLPWALIRAPFYARARRRPARIRRLEPRLARALALGGPRLGRPGGRGRTARRRLPRPRPERPRGGRPGAGPQRRPAGLRQPRDLPRVRAPTPTGRGS